MLIVYCWHSSVVNQGRALYSMNTTSYLSIQETLENRVCYERYRNFHFIPLKMSQQVPVAVEFHMQLQIIKRPAFTDVSSISCKREAMRVNLCNTNIT